jgi:hypothetical protein
MSKKGIIGTILTIFTIIALVRRKLSEKETKETETKDRTNNSKYPTQTTEEQKSSNIRTARRIIDKVLTLCAIATLIRKKKMKYLIFTLTSLVHKRV